MKLSVIIVNYNVRFFLEQCLQSVFKALGNISSEVIVVDNNSVDGSVAMVRDRFPAVILIQNKQNVGFSRANNQGIEVAGGSYVLLLNPDTVVEEDTFFRILDFMDQTPQAGALGVKMIDGQGNYLPESKRGLPTPMVAFYKIFGLAALFPRSRRFGQYHLSYLDKNNRQEVDILSGAFMFIRREALVKTGGLDEQFFMYGEDIDLSYRIKKAGYQVIYFPDTTIIHYKGESTRKNSLNYVYLFYNAMLIFANKHFSRKVAGGLSFLIHLAIYFRAFLSLMRRVGMKILLPAADLVGVYGVLRQLSIFWGNFKFSHQGYYPELYYYMILPGYILLWMLSLLFSGGYDRSVKLKNLISGILSGTLLILVLYALLPLEFRFSRMLILSGSLLTFCMVMFNRFLFSFLDPRFAFWKNRKKTMVIIGDRGECDRIRSMLLKMKLMPDQLFFVSPTDTMDPEFLGHVSQLEDIIRVHRINEIIFCAAIIPASAIIGYMLEFSDTDCIFKIAPANTGSIIGSNSITSAGELLVYSLNAITTPSNIRKKRAFDLLASILMILFFPVWGWVKKRPFQLMKDIVAVLAGRKSWIGLRGESKAGNQIKIRKGIYEVHQGLPGSEEIPEIADRVELSYVQDYSLLREMNILRRALKSDFMSKK